MQKIQILTDFVNNYGAVIGITLISICISPIMVFGLMKMISFNKGRTIGGISRWCDKQLENMQQKIRLDEILAVFMLLLVTGSTGLSLIWF